MEANQLKALLTLLDDPDREIFRHVSERLLGQGEEVIPMLEEAWETSLNPLVQDRIEELVSLIQTETTHKGLADWANSLKLDLLDGAYWISRLQYPELDRNHITEITEKIKKDVWLELNKNLTALEKVKVINYILFDVHGFANHSSNIFSLQSSFVHQVVETKRGNPYSLAIIYAGIAQQLGLPIYGVNLPRNFVLAYKDTLYSEQEGAATANSKVLFYINPYNKGSVLSFKEIDHYLEQLNVEKMEEYYQPCSNVQTLIKFAEHLIASYKKIGYREKAAGMTQLLNILRPIND